MKITFLVYLTLRGDFFMYAAHTQDGLLIYASEAAKTDNRKRDWFCPHCNHLVSLKHSQKGKAFFSHKGPCQNQLSEEKRLRLESNNHLSAKKILAEALMKAGYEVTVEYYFESIQQTADLLIRNPFVNHSMQIIEFQRSPISANQLQKRQKAYLKEVKHCLWLMDDDAFERGRIQTWHKTMLYYSRENGFHWLALNVAKQQIVVKYQVPLIYLATDYPLFEMRLGLDNLGDQCLDLNHTNYPMQSQHYKASQPRVRRLLNYQKRLQQLRNQTTYQAAIHQLYKEGCLIQSLPQWIITEGWHFLVAKTPGWLIFAWTYCLIIQLSQGVSSFTASQLEQGIERLIKQGSIELLKLPFVEADVCQLLTEAILDKLQEKKLIIQFQNNEWQVVDLN